MSDIIKKATRESYGEALKELAEQYQNLVVLDADLAAATKTGIFKKAYPERFFDCGIAEANMMGVAAGLATVGKIPFASTFAMFAAGRAFEIVRNSIGYPHLNVKIGATHAGISVGEDGATHQCNEDIALMRTIPGMVILNPADDETLPEKEEKVIEGFGSYPISKGVISLQNTRGTSYNAYLKVQNELVKAVNEIRDEFALQNFGKIYMSLDEDKQRIVRDAIPQNISEADPKDTGKK